MDVFCVANQAELYFVDTKFESPRGKNQNDMFFQTRLRSTGSFHSLSSLSIIITKHLGPVLFIEHTVNDKIKLYGRVYLSLLPYDGLNFLSQS